MIEKLPPEHMDRWSRNERLYRQLLGLGFYVVPIFADEEHTRIEYLHVSTDSPLQSSAQQPAETGVILPVEGAGISEGFGTTKSVGDGVVINFPSIL